MTTRDEIYEALFALTSAIPGITWKQEPSRRLRLWADVPPENRPCMYQFEGMDENYTWKNDVVAEKVYEARLVYYFKTDDGDPGSPQMNKVLDALDAKLRPSPGASIPRQTLGGLVHSARIQGKVTRVPGDIDGDGMLIVPISIICN